MKLRRQTLTFTSCRLKEFLVEQQSRRVESATKHKVLLRTYQGSPRSTASGPTTQVPASKWKFVGLDTPETSDFLPFLETFWKQVIQNKL